MLFLVQLLKKTDGTFSKGTSEYEDEKSCLTALYIAMSSAMSKQDTEKITCVILDENGAMIKHEAWSTSASESIV